VFVVIYPLTLVLDEADMTVNWGVADPDLKATPRRTERTTSKIEPAKTSFFFNLFVFSLLCYT